MVTGFALNFDVAVSLDEEANGIFVESTMALEFVKPSGCM